MAAGRNAFSAGAGPDEEHALETRAMGEMGFPSPTVSAVFRITCLIGIAKLMDA